MACGDCQKSLDALRQEVVDLRAVLDDLKSEYLALARDFDELVELQHGKDEDE